MSSTQPHSQPQPQMCLLKYNYCECKGCHNGLRKFQQLVEKTYKIPKPSLDKHGIVIVIGTADATGVKKLFKEATAKKYVEILPIPKKETGEAEREANQPPPPPREANNNMGSEEGIAATSRGNMLQGDQYYSIDDNNESPWNSLSDENAKSCTIM